MHVVAWVVDCQHKDVENWNSIVQTSTGPGSVNPHNCLLVSFLFCATFYDYVIILTFLLSLFSPRLLALTKETKKNRISLSVVWDSSTLQSYFLASWRDGKKAVDVKYNTWSRFKKMPHTVSHPFMHHFLPGWLNSRLIGWPSIVIWWGSKRLKTPFVLYSTRHFPYLQSGKGEDKERKRERSTK